MVFLRRMDNAAHAQRPAETQKERRNGRSPVNQNFNLMP